MNKFNPTNIDMKPGFVNKAEDILSAELFADKDFTSADNRPYIEGSEGF